MLQRMNELAIQSANGTNSESDRTALQNEIDQLTTEIDRVSETTKFNETYLLKGDKAVTKGVRYQYKSWATGTTAAASVTFANNGVDATTGLKVQVSFASTATGVSLASQNDQNAVAKAIRDSGLTVTETKTWDATADGGKGQSINTYNLSLTGDAAQKYDVVAVTTSGKSNSNSGVFTIQTKGGEIVAKITVSSTSTTFLPAATATSQVQSASATISATGATAAKTTGHGESAEYFDKDGNRISNNALNRYFSMSDGTTKATVQARGDAPRVYDAVGNLTTLNTKNIGSTRDLTGALNVSLHVGADATTNNKITLNIENMSSKNLGVNGLRIDGSDSSNADLAVETIKEALQKVSDQRAELGAVQNRLEHTINNLDNVVENTEANRLYQNSSLGKV
jgi:flagellin